MRDKNWQQQQQRKHELKVKRLEGRILPNFCKSMGNQRLLDIYLQCAEKVHIKLGDRWTFFPLWESNTGKILPGK